MNNRDPFNLRRAEPSALFRPAARFASRSVHSVQIHLENLAEKSRPVSEPSIEEPGSPALGGMSSYAFPGAASIDQHSNENSTWQQRKTKAAQSELTGASETLSKMFQGKEDLQLPMYKDKPYNYSASSKKLPFYRRQRLILLLTAALGSFLYFSGTLGWLTGSTSRNNGFGGFGFLSRKKLEDIKTWGERQEKVKEAFKVSWKAYEDHAWGHDEFHPLSKAGDQMVPEGMGWIIVDALDTMIIMNLTAELHHAREWISTSLNYDQDQNVNTFETTIRMLGGLLSAHYLTTTFPSMAPLPESESATSEDLYLEKATDLGDRLLGAYESQSGVPFASVNLKTGQGVKSHADGGASSTAEAASLQLEMKYLAKLTGEKHYWDAAEKVIQVIDDNGMRDGLLPIFIYADQGVFRGENIRLGSRGDSYYEYLIKQYLQTSLQEPIYLDLWDESLAGVRKHLLVYSHRTNLTILAERPNGLDGTLSPKMDHLVCFMPGTIALGATEGLTLAAAKKRSGWGKKQEEDIRLSKELMKTCWGMYKVTATGLSPEIAHFHVEDKPVMVVDELRQSPQTLSDDPNAEWRKDYNIHSQDFHNLQRPETVESLFYMWRITGDEIYREWGWQMFESFMEYTAIENGGGYTSLDNVNHIPPPKRDNMESFWLAETLKYFYLLFGPNDILPLDQIVLNTEAHPFPRFELGKLFFTGWKRKARDADGHIIKDEARSIVPKEASSESHTVVVQVEEAKGST